MKKTKIYMFILSALLPLLWLACSKEMPADAPVEPIAEKGNYPVTFSLAKGLTATPKTYANVTALEGERKISSMVALAFEGNDDKFIGAPLPVTISNQVAEDQTETDSKLTGKFDLDEYGSDGKEIKFVLVANVSVQQIQAAMQSLVGKVSSANALTDLTLDNIKALEITNAPDAQQHFVMLSTQEYQVTLQEDTEQSVTTPIIMRRLSARIDAEIGGGTQNNGLTIQKITVKNSQQKSYLYEKAGGNDHLDAGKTDKDYDISTSQRDYSVYTYENSQTADTHLEVTFALNGNTLKPVEVDFAGKAIERNHIYKVTFNRDANDVTDPSNPNQNSPKITFKIDVEDWNVSTDYVEGYADTSAPVIHSVTQKASDWAADITPSTITLNPDNTQVGVSKEVNYLAVEVHSKSTQTEAEVTSGATWVTVSDVTTYAGMQQDYQVEVAENTATATPRTATIEFRNKLDVSQKIVMTITQEAATATLTYTAPTVTSVTQKQSNWTTDANPVTMNATASNTQINVDNAVNYLVLDVTGGNAHSSAAVTSTGTPWVTVTNSAATNPYNDEFRVEVEANTTNTQRTATIEITNDADPTKKVVVTITQAAAAARPTLALERVAEYNLAPNGTSFMTTHQYSSNQQGYFNWNEAVQHGNAMSGYHLPTREEWASIFPYSSSYISFTQNTPYNNVNETIEINGTTQNYRADYRNMGNRVSYAIKMKGNGEVNRTAYRYRLLGTNGGTDYRVVVEAVYLGPTSSETINTVANPTFWTTHASEIVSREFWAAGYDGSSARGSLGYFWSAAPYGSSFAWYMTFNSGNAYVFSYNQSYRFSVRLFAD